MSIFLPLAISPAAAWSGWRCGGAGNHAESCRPPIESTWVTMKIPYFLAYLTVPSHFVRFRKRQKVRREGMSSPQALIFSPVSPDRGVPPLFALPENQLQNSELKTELKSDIERSTHTLINARSFSPGDLRGHSFRLHFQRWGARIPGCIHLTDRLAKAFSRAYRHKRGILGTVQSVLLICAEHDNTKGQAQVSTDVSVFIAWLPK